MNQPTNNWQDPGWRLRTEVVQTDSQAVVDIVRSTGFFREDEIAVARELVDERLAKGTASGYYFVFCEVGDRVAAYTCFGPIACTVNRFDLYWIAVGSSFQRRGLGLAAMQATEEAIQTMGGKRIYIETSSKELYVPTRAFYAKCGYELHATLEGFYDDFDDKCIYMKEFLPFE